MTLIYRSTADLPGNIKVDRKWSMRSTKSPQDAGEFLTRMNAGLGEDPGQV